MTMLSQHLRAETPDPTSPGHWRGMPPDVAAAALRARVARNRLEYYRDRAVALDIVLADAARSEEDPTDTVEPDEDALVAAV